MNSRLAENGALIASITERYRGKCNRDNYDMLMLSLLKDISQSLAVIAEGYQQAFEDEGNDLGYNDFYNGED